MFQVRGNRLGATILSGPDRGEPDEHRSVADADRSKAFYTGLGWRLDADFSFDNRFRVVQYAQWNGFLTLLSDGARLTGAYALGAEAGEWLQQSTLAIRARVPLEVLSDVIQPFPSFSTIFDSAFKTLRMEIAQKAAAFAAHAGADGTAMTMEDHRR